jgi:hypothetical protein
MVLKLYEDLSPEVKVTRKNGKNIPKFIPQIKILEY